MSLLTAVTHTHSVRSADLPAAAAVLPASTDDSEALCFCRVMQIYTTAAATHENAQTHTQTRTRLYVHVEQGQTTGRIQSLCMFDVTEM